MDNSLSKQVSIIIPAYNEAAGIRMTLKSLCECSALSEAEIILVDDGSCDDTASIANEFPRVLVVKHTFNKGYGTAIKTGVRTSNRDYIAWFDADGQHRVEDLVKICERIVEKNLDYCIGIRDSSSYQEPSRILGKWFLKLAVNFASGRDIKDFNSGLRVFRREILLRYLHLLPKGFGASTLTTLLMIEGDHFGEEVEITVSKRAGESTVKIFRDGFRTLRIVLHIFLLFKPLHFFGSIGALFIIVGLVYGLIKALTINLGFPVLASLSIILGVQTFFLGLLCDQISSLRRERFDIY